MRVGSYHLVDGASALLARFEHATVEDKLAERKARRFRNLWVAALLGGIVLGFAGIVVPVLLRVAAVLAVLFVVFLVLAIRQSGHDLDDRKLGAVIRLLKVLGADIPRGERVALKVDFRDYTRGGQLQRQGGAFGPRVLSYQHGWLELRARLADGSRVRIAVTELVKRKEKPKRKSTKVRLQAQSVVALSVRLAKPYGASEAVAQRLSGLPTPPSLLRRRVVARGRWVHATVARTAPPVRSSQVPSESLVVGDDLLRALRWVYRGIAASRRAA